MSAEDFQATHTAYLNLIKESDALARRAHSQIRQSRVAIDESRRLLSETVPSFRPIELPEGMRQQKTSVPGRTDNALELISGCHFENTVLPLDGKHFVDCSVKNCILEYSGEQVVLERTSFSGSTFRWNGAAAMTLSLLECFNIVGSNTLAPCASDQDSGQTARIN